MGLRVDCPYCDHENEEEWEDIPREEDDSMETQCAGCEKYFTYTHDVIHTSSSEKAPCLNGEADHDWTQLTRYPLIRSGKVGELCKTCPEAREVLASTEQWDHLEKMNDEFDLQFAGTRPGKSSYIIPESVLNPEKKS